MKYFYGIIILFFLAISVQFLYNYNRREESINNTKVINVIKPSIKEKELYKDFNPISKATLDIPKEAPIGKKIQVDVFGNTSNQVLQVTSFKIDYGFRNKFGVFGSAGIKDIDLGLTYSPLYWYRFNTDLICGIKNTGIGLSYQLLRNTSIGLSYNLRYNNLLFEPRIYVSLGL